MAQFLGKKEVEKLMEIEETKSYSITFTDGISINMKKNLFDLIVSENKEEVEILDKVRHIFSKRILNDMTEFGIDMNTTQHIINGVKNLSINALNSCVANMFGAENTDTIKLSQISKFFQ
jgi:hypothetical protein